MLTDFSCALILKRFERLCNSRPVYVGEVDDGQPIRTLQHVSIAYKMGGENSLPVMCTHRLHDEMRTRCSSEFPLFRVDAVGQANFSDGYSIFTRLRATCLHGCTLCSRQFEGELGLILSVLETVHAV
jgi:hypothetical protein